MTRIRKAFCASLLGVFIAFADAGAADYDGLIAQARIQLEGARIVDALAASTEATRLNPADFRGHYYSAMALMSLGRFDDSEAAAAQALALAPASGRAAVEKLRDAVKARKDEAAAEQAASAALAEGLFGKAAPAYERAWLSGRTRPDLGLKAADLYANRLKSPIDAGRVLRQVIAATPGRPEAELAQTELQKVAPALRTIAQEHVAVARDNSGEEALRRLALAEAADPDLSDIFIQRARIAGGGSNVEAMRGALKDLARLNLATPDVLGNLADMPRWLERPEMAAYLEDLIGRSQVETVGKVLAVKAEERRKADEDRRVADEARRAKELKEEQDRLYATGEIGIRKNSNAEAILRKMKKLESNNFSEYKSNRSLFMAMVREYSSLWSEYFYEFIDPVRPVLASRSENLDDFEAFIDFSPRFSGMSASEIDAKIRSFNHEIGVLHKRPHAALANLYEGMEKFAMADEAESIEGIRINSFLWSRVYVEADEDRRGKKFTVDQCVKKYEVSMEKFRATIAKW
jgi:hypothetical protein